MFSTEIHRQCDKKSQVGTKERLVKWEYKPPADMKSYDTNYRKMII